MIRTWKVILNSMRYYDESILIMMNLLKSEVETPGKYPMSSIEMISEKNSQKGIIAFINYLEDKNRRMCFKSDLTLSYSRVKIFR